MRLRSSRLDAGVFDKPTGQRRIADNPCLISASRKFNNEEFGNLQAIEQNNQSNLGHDVIVAANDPNAGKSGIRGNTGTMRMIDSGKLTIHRTRRATMNTRRTHIG